MVIKRSTVRIDDDLMTDLKAGAHRENISLTRMLNRVLRKGLAAVRQRGGERIEFEEIPVSMGRAYEDIGAALALAADLEDKEIIRKLSLRK